MESRKLPDAQVFNGRQKLLKLRYKLFFCGFLSFVSFHTFIHTWSKKAYIVQQVSFSKMTANLTGGKSWRLCGKKGNDFLYVASLT